MSGVEATDEDARALAVALEAARRGGLFLLAHHGHLDPKSISSKSARRDLVSAADRAAEREVLAAIAAAFPDDAVHAEESARAPSGAAGAVWYVDPLDGTTNFVHGLPEFTVSIARFVGNAPRVAVVHAPKLGETFAARRGRGTTRNGELVRVSATGELADALLATGFPYRRTELPSDNVANFVRMLPRVRDLRRLGSAALDLAFVACGRFDAYWELHLERHDVAAGGLLVLEAGGRVSDLEGGPDWHTGRSILASNGALHDVLRGLLAP